VNQPTSQSLQQVVFTDNQLVEQSNYWRHRLSPLVRESKTEKLRRSVDLEKPVILYPKARVLLSATVKVTSVMHKNR